MIPKSTMVSINNCSKWLGNTTLILMSLLRSLAIPRMQSKYQLKLATCIMLRRHKMLHIKWTVPSKGGWFWNRRVNSAWWIGPISDTAWSKCDFLIKSRTPLSAWTSYIKCKFKISKVQRSRNTPCTWKNGRKPIWEQIPSITQMITCNRDNHLAK